MKIINKLVLAFFLLLNFKAFCQPTSFESRGIGGGGALFSPAINPADNNELFMACDMSEIYHSKNKGASWSMLHFKTIQGGHDSKMQFTKDATIRYCIDYTSKDGTDYTRPVKSTDGGKTWNLLQGNPFPTDVAYNLTADYNDPTRLILGFYGEIYFSKDGGTTFKKIYTCKSTGEGNHIAGSFFKGTDIYIGLNDGLLKSSDGGTSFALMTTTGMVTGEKMLSFSAAFDGTNMRFSCLTLTSVWAGIQHAFEYSNGSSANMKGIYIMDNSDGTWKPKLTGVNKATDYPVFIGMAANNIGTIYLSGGSSTGAPIVMKSTDGGTTWNHAFISANNQNIYTGWSGYQGDRQWSYGECPFGFTVAANDANKVIFTDFGFAHGTFDGGTTWQQMYVDPSSQNTKNAATPKGKAYKGVRLENTTNWNMLWTDSTHLLASFSDINGVMSEDKGKSWKIIPNLSQNSVYHIVKHSNGTLYAATSNIHDMYQSTRLTDAIIDVGKGSVYFSTNSGTSFSLLHDFAHPVIWLALDPNNPKRLYASIIHSTLGGVYVSDDIDKGAASTWKKVTNPPRTQGHAFVIQVLKNGNLVASYSGRRTGSPQQFTASSGVFYSTDGGITWQDRSHNNMKYWTKDVVIDPHDTSGSTWYAAVFSGWGSAVPAGTGGLYRTADKGLNWTNISNSAASYRVNSCTVNPKNKDEIYYTTETDGLWFSKNATASSPTFTLVDAYAFRHPVRVTYNPYKNSELWVSGFGSGMITGTVGGGSSGKIALQKRESITVYPNPAKEYLYFKNSSISSYTVYDITGKVLLESNEISNSSETIIDIRFLKQGLYFVVLKTEKGLVSEKFVKE